MSEAAIQIPAATGPDIADTFARLTATFSSGKTKDLAWRRGQLDAVERMMSECEDELMAALLADLGKPRQESFTTELSYVSGDAAHCRKNLKRWTRSKRISTPIVAQPGKSWIQPEPLGVVLVIGAWNYPVQLTLAGMTAAITAGNCVAIKPSELAPATSATLAKIVAEYLDPDCVKVIEGAVDETSALLELPFDHILYTGGGNVARIVMAAAAKNLTPVTLELGGKSPCLVLPDADLKATARRIVWGKFTNAGQTCIAPDYILTDAQTEAKLLPLIQQSITDMYGESPQDSDSYGRMVNERHFERVKGYLDDARAKGAQVIEVNPAGEDFPAAAHKMPITFVLNATDDMVISREEIFGPVFLIKTYTAFADAIDYVNSRPKPLALYYFGEDDKEWQTVLTKTSSGGTVRNDVIVHFMQHELPFGGVGNSGTGRYHGIEGFKCFSNPRGVYEQSNIAAKALRLALDFPMKGLHSKVIKAKLR